MVKDEQCKSSEETKQFKQSLDKEKQIAKRFWHLKKYEGSL